ncbi:Protein of unknown function DUF58 [Cnuella takakiae]|uniref:DUF58 domain-containing protein n=1 Tax=Cnuella takakiae TaxID=1302690 RepID=A0A1M5FI67_9BACT|nr:DUF58 domain-containing protein [Cnuella takakiae]OLY93758.1 hypothetical protein BUE76_19115 [Cnuella takakiae]SHF91195.1 Protein of unknown function DUF58 [Cnuella takakiae]
MLTTAEILRKVRDLEIKSKHLASDLFSGEYHSAFKGKGMSFREVREYYPGDDVRFIDWNVSARFNHPFSKVFEEERELTVMLLVDVSASSLVGTVGGTKKNIATEIAAVLAFAAVNNGDKVGAILYSNKIEKFIPPKKGKQQALFLIRELLGMDATGRGTELKKALQYFNNTNRQKSIAFILSDFLDGGYEDALRIAGNRHDLIGLKLYDKLDQHLPDLGLVQIRDLETGGLQWIDSGSKQVRTQHEQDFFRITETANQAFKKAGSDLLHLRTDEDYMKVLRQFFLSRNR